MVKGTLCIIGCPVLEDEIVYSLGSDKEKKNVYVLGTVSSHTLMKKLEREGIGYSVSDMWEFDNGYVDMNDNEFNVVILMNELGLHVRPESLRRTLEDQMKKYRNRADVIALCYGMCGNYGWDASEFSEEIGIPVFVFRDRNDDVCDDCIGVAVGGRSEYSGFVKKHPGMFYVTPAIVENWEEYSKELDFCKGFEVMNIHTVKEVFQVYGYKNAVMIDTGIGICGEELCEGRRRFSEETGLEFITPDPEVADIYPSERIYRDAKDSLNRRE
ncbi:MAG: DUF1638 domain-containing protein [Methanomassiliicoccaceae archaeon]|nr:DUF1638 domain-containing protein [Methanomassiliicoccaceae archaeon]